MKRAKIEYTQNWKPNEKVKEREGYIIWGKDNEEDWGLIAFYPLVERKNANEDEGANFIKFSIIHTIIELLKQGYKIII